MTQHPQTIQIFLPDGSPTSVKIAEITNRVIKAVLVPRNKLSYMAGRPELKGIGMYFLFGTDEQSAKPLAYIGETEESLQRLREHNRNKTFWKYAVVLISKTDDFTKSHVKFLEHYAIKKALAANRFTIENSNTPKRPTITEPMEADLLDSFETMKVLLSTLGYPIFEHTDKKRVEPKELVAINGKGVAAQGDLLDDGFVVFKGSEAVLKTTAAVSNSVVSLRKNLLEDGTLVQENGRLVFLKDYVFNSPSQASDTVLGGSTNGWVTWKNKDKKTLHELKRA